jgi:hypothetical protein
VQNGNKIFRKIGLQKCISYRQKYIMKSAFYDNLLISIPHIQFCRIGLNLNEFHVFSPLYCYRNEENSERKNLPFQIVPNIQINNLKSIFHKILSKITIFKAFSFLNVKFLLIPIFCNAIFKKIWKIAKQITFSSFF